MCHKECVNVDEDNIKNDYKVISVNWASNVWQAQTLLMLLGNKRGEEGEEDESEDEG